MLNVLVVENCESIQDLCRKKLSKVYLANFVPSGLCAIKFIDTNSVDILLLDMELSAFSGFEVLKYIGSISKSAAPFVVVSSFRGAESRASFYDFGARNFLMKLFGNRGLRVVLSSGARSVSRRNLDDGFLYCKSLKGGPAHSLCVCALRGGAGLSV